MRPVNCCDLLIYVAPDHHTKVIFFSSPEEERLLRFEMIYYDVNTDDVDIDAHGEDNYVYRPLVKYKNYLPLTWNVV